MEKHNEKPRKEPINHYSIAKCMETQKLIREYYLKTFLKQKKKMANRKKLKEIEERLSKSRESLDSSRSTIEGHTEAANAFREGRVDLMHDVLENRIKFNNIIDPIVDALRKAHGQNCNIVMEEEGKGTDSHRHFISLKFEENGLCRMVPKPNVESIKKCYTLADHLLRTKLAEKGAFTENEQDEFIRKILSNRFYVESSKNVGSNRFQIVQLITEESMYGYNAVERNQRNKNNN